MSILVLCILLFVFIFYVSFYFLYGLNFNLIHLEKLFTFKMFTFLHLKFLMFIFSKTVCMTVTVNFEEIYNQ